MKRHERSDQRDKFPKTPPQRLTVSQIQHKFLRFLGFLEQGIVVPERYLS